jgi:hypothetical protein
MVKKGGAKRCPSCTGPTSRAMPCLLSLENLSDVQEIFGLLQLFRGWRGMTPTAATTIEKADHK